MPARRKRDRWPHDAALVVEDRSGLGHVVHVVAHLGHVLPVDHEGRIARDAGDEVARHRRPRLARHLDVARVVVALAVRGRVVGPYRRLPVLVGIGDAAPVHALPRHVRRQGGGRVAPRRPVGVVPVQPGHVRPRPEAERPFLDVGVAEDLRGAEHGQRPRRLLGEGLEGRDGRQARDDDLPLRHEAREVENAVGGHRQPRILEGERPAVHGNDALRGGRGRRAFHHRHAACHVQIARPGRRHALNLDAAREAVPRIVQLEVAAARHAQAARARDRAGEVERLPTRIEPNGEVVRKRNRPAPTVNARQGPRLDGRRVPADAERRPLPEDERARVVCPCAVEPETGRVVDRDGVRGRRLVRARPALEPEVPAFNVHRAEAGDAEFDKAEGRVPRLRDRQGALVEVHEAVAELQRLGTPEPHRTLEDDAAAPGEVEAVPVALVDGTLAVEARAPQAEPFVAVGGKAALIRIGMGCPDRAPDRAAVHVRDARRRAKRARVRRLVLARANEDVAREVRHLRARDERAEARLDERPRAEGGHVVRRERPRLARRDVHDGVPVERLLIGRPVRNHVARDKRLPAEAGEEHARHLLEEAARLRRRVAHGHEVAHERPLRVPDLEREKARLREVVKRARAEVGGKKDERAFRLEVAGGHRDLFRTVQEGLPRAVVGRDDMHPVLHEEVVRRVLAGVREAVEAQARGIHRKAGQAVRGRRRPARTPKRARGVRRADGHLHLKAVRTGGHVARIDPLRARRLNPFDLLKRGLRHAPRTRRQQQQFRFHHFSSPLNHSTT